ncbi:DoxX family protein [Bradyrhizobium prioriisuperbiae]|uniref:DoxX family protein n=1 Tax=Bradyrhizobium prioriisuperbiae TaxID=2854389 RepID=UPI0028ECBF45|nr:DoxX family protein [Bradyrhizobium prioritasuperba]
MAISAEFDKTTTTAAQANGVILLFARVLFVPLFYYSGIGKVLAFGVTASRLPGGAEGLGNLLAAGAIAIELGCGTALLLGIWARQAAAVLIGFTIVATLMFHPFWASPETQVTLQTVQFLKNVGLVGGLALVAAFGAGPYSLQAALARR